MESTLSLDAFVTLPDPARAAGLDDLVDQGFETLIHHNETAVKILVSPTGQGL